MMPRIGIVLALVAAFTNVAIGQDVIQFSPAEYITSGEHASTPKIADINEDGHLDFVNVNYYGNDAFVFVGDGAGGFVHTQTLSIGGYPADCELGDINNDGHVDSLMSNTNSATVSVFLGLGTGSFISQGTYSVTFSPYRVTLGDVNNDGQLDFATANSVGNNLSLRLGNGSGGFGGVSNSPVVTKPTGVVLVDLNADGNLDFISANAYSANIGVRLGNGNGTFGALTYYSTIATGQQFVHAGDLNGDTFPDAIVPTELGISIFFGNGMGGFLPVSNIDIGGLYHGVSPPTDFNNDGFLDLVITNWLAQAIVPLAGDGTGQFTFGPQSSVFTCEGPSGVNAGDFTEVGMCDITINMDCPGSGGPNLAVLRNQSGPLTGISQFGTGTPGCAGSQVLWAINSPKIGNLNFTLKCNNAPPSSLGGWFICDSKDELGSDPFFVGIKFHVDFYNATELFVIDAPSNAAGIGTCIAPIPNDPNLVGHTYYVQAIWAWALTV